MIEPTIDDDATKLVSARRAAAELGDMLEMTSTDIPAADMFSLYQGQNLQLDDVEKEKLENYRNVFEKFDRDGTDSISVHNLAEIMNSFGIKAPNDETLKKIIDRMHALSTDGPTTETNDVTFEDFVRFLELQTADETIEDVIRAFFAASDTDRTGVLTTSQLTNAIQRLGLSFSEYDAAALLGGSHARWR